MIKKGVKFKITRDRAFYLSPCYWNGIYQTSLQTKKIYGVSLEEEWNYYSNYRMMAIQNEENWKRAGEYIVSKISNKEYFKKIQKAIEKEERNIENFLGKAKKINFSSLSFQEIIKIAKKIKKLSLDYDSANVLSWYVAGDKFLELIKKNKKISEDDYDFVATPLQKTYVSQLEEKVLEYALLIKSGKKDLDKSAQFLADKFGWIPFGYDGLEYWDRKYFVKLLKQKIKNHKKTSKELKVINLKDKKDKIKRKEISSELSVKEKEQIKIANYLAIWTDERKRLTFNLYYYYSQCLLRFSKDFDIPYINLKYLFTEELKDILRSQKKLLKLSQKRMESDLVIYFKNGKYWEVDPKEKKFVSNSIKSKAKVKNIKGFVASRGKKNIYKGTAKIVLSAKEGRKIKSGDFLVSGMTTPDFMVSMKKALGFITDEGGVTCHAAIVAREMNKPCIIGTKNATRILKDSDKIEVNTRKGTVKIIK